MATNNTFEDVEKFITDNGLFFSDADLNLARTNPDAGMTIANYKLDYKNATTDDQRALANAGAESTRKNYGGYTGGSDGSKFYLTDPSPQNYGYQQPTEQQSSFTYQQPGTQAGIVEGGLDYGAADNTAQKETNSGVNIGQYSDWVNPYQDLMNSTLNNIINREQYASPYADQQKAALDAVMNRQEFNYDPSQDAAWQSAKKMYLREADRATQDMMGQAAALTGGMASTAAITAAQQAGDYYRGQMNDALGDYQQQAYQRYLDDANLDYSQLDAINNMSESDYQKYVDSLGFDYDQASLLNTLGQQARAEFDTDRNFGYNQWTDGLAYQTDKEQTEYEREWAEAQDKYQKEQDAYEKEQAAKEDARYETEYGDAISFDLYNSLMADYEVTGSSSVLKRARAILEALEKQIS